MALTRDEAKVRKAKILLRAQRALKEKLARVDWDEEVLYPTIEALKSGKAALGLPANVEFTVEVVDEDPVTPEALKGE